MLALVRLTLAALFGLCAAFPATAQFTVIPSGTTATLYDVAFASATTGWIVGASGTILKTTDGGASWAAQPSGTTASLVAVAALDASTAVAVEAGSKLYRTTDGGASWAALDLGGGHVFQDVAFASATTGWIVGASGTILKTTDGGTSWAAQPSGTAAVLHALSFLDASRGWVAGAGGLIRTTADGGASWAAQPSGTTMPLYGLTFFDAQHGWAVGGAGSDRIVLLTTDGGQTWQSQTASSTLPLRDVAFVTTLKGWGVGDGVLKTVDGCQTCTEQNTGTTATFYGAALAGTDAFFAVGTDGTIITEPVGALPVELVAFTATQQGRSAVLRWTTASETNNAGFHVEHRPASGAAFRDVAFVAGRGTALEAAHYGFTAERLAPGRHAFRLRQMDFDGAFAYGPEVELVVEDAQGGFEHVPGLLRSGDAVTFSAGATRHARVVLYDVLGRSLAVLHDGRCDAPTQAFLPAGLAAGAYVLRLETGATRHTRVVTVVD